jgi:hypothetical protein
MGEITTEYKVLIEKLKGRDHLKDLRVDERILLEEICREIVLWTGFIRIGTSGRFL